ncbi:trypsin-like peptidase domain-containing protein [Thiothrix lacustris]|uniref:Serine protease n=1 Tax=Thiothrix lacustris TaxID=525917 RepID=A0ABY9MP41_9GAMM|nr:trypsin-like peptidase domain-containing protein [Thiothrix lacustris]WML90327.1 trypsin-like peptidase domain-containing protein [Thiothrix lacustris]
MMNLPVGANLPLTGTRWATTITFPQDIHHDLGLAILPVNEAKQLVSQPYLAHAKAPTWATANLNEAGTRYALTLDVAQLSDATITHLYLVLYRYGARGPIDVGKHVALQMDEVFNHHIALQEIPASALMVAEFYLRGGQWKVRALAETSAYGLAALGRRMGMDVDERSPFATPGNTEQRPGNWTGTAFLVAPNVFMSNAHVVDGANHIRLNSLQGKLDAEPIISDSTNDLALLRAATPSQLQPLPFRSSNIGLAQAITTLGYPLAGLMGNGIQVTQGVISGLFGAHNDIRLLQFTAPIQPGSSGSPLLDETGAVLGVVSSTFTHAQNMNFAIRHVLAIALMEAANIQYLQQTNTQTLSAAQMVQQTQNAIWRVECAG